MTEEERLRGSRFVWMLEDLIAHFDNRLLKRREQDGKEITQLLNEGRSVTEISQAMPWVTLARIQGYAGSQKQKPPQAVGASRGLCERK